MSRGSIRQGPRILNADHSAPAVPWLPARDFRDKGQTAAQIMKPADTLVVLEDDMKMSLRELDRFLTKHSYHGFPVVCEDEYVGFVLKDQLRVYIGATAMIHAQVLPVLTYKDIESLINGEDGQGGQRRFTFSQPRAAENPEVIDLSTLLEDSVLQLRKDVPLQLVVTMFQKMVSIFP